jgi:16S rRNA G527 N7-methylase RsmG
LGKRIDFVNEAAAALGLTNVVGLWARAEDAGKNLNGLKQREVRV